MFIVSANNVKYEKNLSTWVELIYFFIRTKILFRSARLIRFPIDIRGKKSIDWGKNLTTGKYCRIEAFAMGETRKKIVFGESVQINDFVHISAMNHVEIGDNTLIASHVYISDNSHGIYKNITEDTDPRIVPCERNYLVDSVFIGENCWLGEGVIVLPGVSVGQGCIIGAHSVVNKNIPPYSIAVGAPIRIVKRYSLVEKKWVKLDC